MAGSSNTSWKYLVTSGKNHLRRNRVIAGRNIYLQFVRKVKQQILQSRYQAAKLVNRELLLLYYQIGAMLTEKARKAKWGSDALARIASELQSELPGLRGFSAQNLKKMRLVYESYSPFIASAIGSTLSNQLKQKSKNSAKLLKSSTLSNFLNPDSFAELFFQLSFSHLFLLAISIKEEKELQFYMKQSVQYHWSYRLLQHHIESDLYRQKGKLSNNFKKALPKSLAAHALNAFKDGYLLDYININPEDDERVLERGIVDNIKHFILSFGTGFSFIGNPYRLEVEEEEFFTDLLFFNRQLQCLVAVELKNGKFKPEYAGKLNFYLNVLNEQVKLSHENNSIGIILCKEKNNKVVEYAFKTITNAIGVATYKTSKQLPLKFKKALPSAEDLKKLL